VQSLGRGTTGAAWVDGIVGLASGVGVGGRVGGWFARSVRGVGVGGR
jgi:hypothetical protein